ncbi:MAG: hypothetical protein IKC08_06160 [Lentisphaeria bacterium]|nr:hypothetical protein [Lentisphaeria bacterium]
MSDPILAGQEIYQKNREKKDRIKRVFIVVFFFLLALFSVIALNIKYGNGRAFFGSRKAGKIATFDPAAVRKIILSWKTSKVTLVMGKDQLWYIEERKMSPASAARVGDMLHHLSTVQVLKELEDPAPEMLRSLNLVEKEDEKEDEKEKAIPGIRVVLLDGNNKTLFKVLLGSGHYPPASKDTPGTVAARGRYVLNNGHVFLVSRLFENCIPLPQAYVEPLAIMNMNTVLLVMRAAREEKKDKDGKSISSGTILSPVWALARQQTSRPLSVAFPRNAVLDARKFAAYSETLAKQLTVDILPDLKDTDVILSSMITLQLADGFSYRLGIGKKDKNDVLVPEVSFDPGKIKLLPGESKKRHQARIQGAKLRFESEKRYYNGKVFLMVPGVAEKLSVFPFRERKNPVRKAVRDHKGKTVKK